MSGERVTTSSNQTSGSVQRVYRGILSDLEHGRMVPGQRLAETELAAQFAVGRNAVREAMQRLAVRGVVDLSRNRSPAIRRLDREETLEVLDVAEVMTALCLRTAAARFRPDAHTAWLDGALATLETAENSDEVGEFSQARRNLYRIMLEIGGNRELRRLFPAIGMHIIYAQYQTRQLRGIRLADYRAMITAVRTGQPDAASEAGRLHVANVRAIILGSQA